MALKWLKRVCLGLAVAVVGWVAFVFVSDWLFRLKAESLLRRIQALELRKSGWAEAEAIRKEFAEDVTVESTCSSANCDFAVILSHNREPLNHYLIFDLLPGGDKLECTLWRMRRLVGERAGWIRATVRVRNGVVWGKGFAVSTEMRARPDCAFVASAATVPRFFMRRGGPAEHLNIEWGAPGGCECCIERWAEITPYASAEEMHEAFAFSLSCLGPRLGGCEDVAQLHPSAARHYEEESKQYNPQKPVQWTAQLYRRLGRYCHSAAVMA